MISKLSQKVTQKLILRGSIEPSEKEIYDYGFFMLFSQIIFGILTFVAGMIFACPVQSIVFYFAFSFLRKYAGGYHASTETKCIILSSGAMICAVAIIKIAKVYGFNLIVLCVSAVFAVVVALLSPIDTSEKPLSQKERKHYRIITLIILSTIMCLAVISYFLNADVIFVPCSVGVILEAILLVAGKTKNVKKKKEK